MKPFTVRITPKSEAYSLVESLEGKLEKGAPLTPADALVLDQAKACIHEFTSRAKSKLASGTTIQISKTFSLSSSEFTIRLECPGRSNILEKFTSKLRGDI